MTRVRVLVAIAVIVPLAALIYWVSEHTRWIETRVPMPPKGEALVNPFYAAQRFAEALGVRTSWDRRFTTPPAQAVVVVSSWHWDLSPPRREALEHWVESGGRLVVDATLAGNRGGFERWSGIVRQHEHRNATRDERVEDDETDEDDDSACPTFEETPVAGVANPVTPRRFQICGHARGSFLRTAKPMEWRIGDRHGAQAMRVRVGRGSVTVVNAAPFRTREFFQGDHPQLLAAVTGIARGDELHFLSEEDHPSLLAITWQQGAPVIVLLLVGVALTVWRAATRFGPPVATPPTARRSLAEQIRGTGVFVARHGGEPLHAASVRALEERAARRVAGYARLSKRDRLTALARLTGYDAHALGVALYHPDSHNVSELRRTLALLESARRRITIERTRSSHVPR